MSAPYTADYEGWPIVIRDAKDRNCVLIPCVETVGPPCLPSPEAYELAARIVTLLNQEAP